MGEKEIFIGGEARAFRIWKCRACGKLDVPVIRVHRDRDRWRCLDCFIGLLDDVALCSVDRMKLARERDEEAKDAAAAASAG